MPVTFSPNLTQAREYKTQAPASRVSAGPIRTRLEASRLQSSEQPLRLRSSLRKPTIKESMSAPPATSLSIATGIETDIDNTPEPLLGRPTFCMAMVELDDSVGGALISESQKADLDEQMQVAMQHQHSRNLDSQSLEEIKK